MRLVTWNVNGLRSLGPGGSDFTARLEALAADVVCLQETKVTRDMLGEDHALAGAFTSYFSFSRRRTGYSGVATYCSAGATPARAEEGLAGTLPSAKKEVRFFSNFLVQHCCTRIQNWEKEQSTTTSEDAVEGPRGGLGCLEGLEEEFTQEELRELDSEGRAVLTLHEFESGISLVVVNVYCPRADPEDPDRQAFQLKFYKLLEMRAANLVRSGHRVVIVGDINTSHRRIDHCDPYEDFELRPGRQWMTHFLAGNLQDERPTPPHMGTERDEDDTSVPPLWKVLRAERPPAPGQFADAFRMFHPERERAFTCWHTATNSRANNYGTRLDYVLVNVGGEGLAGLVRECEIHPEVEGSDHCPVSAVFEVGASQPPPLPPEHCTKNFAEFSGGRQRKVSHFFQAKVPGDEEGEQPGETSKKKKRSSAGGAAKGPKQLKLSSFFNVKTTSKDGEENLETEDKEDDGRALTLVREKLNDREGEPAGSLPPLSQTDLRRNAASAGAWRSLLSGPPRAPLCRGHGEPAALKTVTKKGPNIGRQFWSCARGSGRADDPNANCNFFKWLKS